MKRSEQLLEQILGILSRQQQGLKQAEIARMLGKDAKEVERALTLAHEQRILLQQDDQGRIRFMEEQF